MSENLIEVKNLKTFFKTEAGIVKAVNDVSFKVKKGETVCVVGESGCGKSITAMSIMGLVSKDTGFNDGGQILFENKDLLKATDAEMRSIRGKDIAMIFQEPMSSLNPTFTIGFQVMEPLILHEGLDKKTARKRAIGLLEEVGIPRANEIVDCYPHELSGGMRQRVMIAMAMSCKPSVLIADEPTTALDVTIQAQILDLIKGLQAEMHAGIILITHDLGVVAEMADRVAVLYAGEVVEIGTAEQIFKNPKHPYTRSLLRSIPQIDDEEADDELYVIQGMVPSLKGCRFADRISWVKDEEHEHNPTLHEVEEGHHVRCTCYKNFEFEGEENNA